MIRVVLYEYRMKFSWKLIGNSMANSEGNPGLMYAILIPLWFAAVSGENRMFLAYLLELPLVINSLMTRMYGNRLPQMMYLIPMEREERREYLRISGWMCFGIPALLYLIGWLLIGRYGGVNALGMVALLIFGIIYMLGNNLYMEGAFKDKELGAKAAGLKNYYGWMLGEKVYILGMLAVYYMYGSTTNVITGLAAFLLIMVVCSAVGILAGLMRYSRQIAEMALDYEVGQRYEEPKKKRKVRT